MKEYVKGFFTVFLVILILGIANHYVGQFAEKQKSNRDDSSQALNELELTVSELETRNHDLAQDDRVAFKFLKEWEGYFVPTSRQRLSDLVQQQASRLGVTYRTPDFGQRERVFLGDEAVNTEPINFVFEGSTFALHSLLEAIEDEHKGARIETVRFENEDGVTRMTLKYVQADLKL